MLSEINQREIPNGSIHMQNVKQMNITKHSHKYREQLIVTSWEGGEVRGKIGEAD